MSRNQRLALLAAAVAVVVAAIVIAGGGDDDEDTAQAPSTPSADTSTEESPTATAPSAPEPPPVPAPTRIEITQGKPVGGVKEITVKKGERIRFTVASGDTTEEVHLHGYNVSKDLTPGKPVSFNVAATIEGVFEVELEESAVPIAEVKVEPS